MDLGFAGEGERVCLWVLVLLVPACLRGLVSGSAVLGQSCPPAGSVWWVGLLSLGAVVRPMCCCRTESKVCSFAS